MNRRLLSLTLPLLLVCPLAAQRTIVVDGAGGPGHDYKSLANAITAAKDGDILLVRPGTYAWIKTPLSKGITVQASGANVNIWGNLDIAGLPAQSSFTMKDINVAGGVGVLSCKGSVLLDGLVPWFSGVSVAAKNSHRLTVRNCSVHSVRIESGTAQVEGGQIGRPGEVAPPRIEVWDSVIEVTNTLVFGSSYFVVYPGTVGSRPSVYAIRSDVRIRGRLAELHAAQPSSSVYSAPVLEGHAGSTLTIDPIVKLRQHGSAPLITGFTHVTRKTLPTLFAPARPDLGQLWSYSIESQQNDVFVIAIGLPSAPLPILDGFLHLQPQSMIVMNVGRQPASGSSIFTIRHSNQAVYRGSVFTMQAAVGAKPQLSNPVAISVR